jgi:hypothetical protein
MEDNANILASLEDITLRDHKICRNPACLITLEKNND